MVHRQDLFHRRKTFQGFGEEGRADILVLVQQVIFQQQPGLRIKIRPFLGQQSQIVVGRSQSMLDFSAPGKS